MHEDLFSEKQAQSTPVNFNLHKLVERVSKYLQLASNLNTTLRTVGLLLLRVKRFNSKNPLLRLASKQSAIDQSLKMLTRIGNADIGIQYPRSGGRSLIAIQESYLESENIRLSVF